MERLITALLEERGMSLAELTAQLGYQSKTSLVRIMKHQANQRALDTFLKKLNERLSLTEEEQEQLADVMEYLRWQGDYDSSREMLQFLRGEPIEDDVILLEDSVTGETSHLADRYAEASEISITLLNCPYVSIFRLLHKLVRQKNAAVEHFLLMHEDSARVIRALHVLMPLIYEKNYNGYSYRKSEFGRIFSAQGVLFGDVMVVSYRTADGIALEDMVVFDHAGHGIVQTAPQTGSFLRLLGICRDEFIPIKRTFFQSVELENYIRFCEEYARLEHNRMILKIKPDLGLECVPYDVIHNALRDGGLMQRPGVEPLLEDFSRVHHERVLNIYEKRRVSRIIMKRSAMIRFARIGRMSDHVWAMRPFNVEERVRILQLMLENEENNPYFNISFLKENDYLMEAEIAYYEGVGILITDSHTDYALDGNYSEVMLVHGGFMRLFREYYERSLLAEQVTSRAETIAFMNELIKIARSEG